MSLIGSICFPFQDPITSSPGFRIFLVVTLPPWLVCHYSLQFLLLRYAVRSLFEPISKIDFIVRKPTRFQLDYRSAPSCHSFVQTVFQNNLITLDFHLCFFPITNIFVRVIFSLLVISFLFVLSNNIF